MNELGPLSSIFNQLFSPQLNVVKILTLTIRTFNCSTIELEHVGEQLAALVAPDDH